MEGLAVDIASETIMPTAWGVVGFDQFDMTYYPKAVCNFPYDARMLVAKLSEDQPGRQPGGLHDVFAAYPLPEAARRCDMSVEQFVQFVSESQTIEPSYACPHCKDARWFDVEHPGMPDIRPLVLQVRCRCQSPFLAYRVKEPV